jgi:predicted ATPase/DNA-binding XRE family transcriptional regulator
MSALSTPAFGEVLRQQRTAAGLTQEALAARARISVRAISDLERGVRRTPHPDTLRLLAQALGLSVEQQALLVAAVRQTRRAAALSSTAATDHYSRDLPVALTPLIGREREEATIAHVLRQEEVRLLTLTGPAGIGKTRLATQAASEHAARCPSCPRVVFVSLAALREPAQVLPAIAQALGLPEPVEQSALEQVSAYLSRRALLLALDNFEQVVQAGPELTRLLAACPQVKALVTSRVALRVRGEQEVAVPSLATPQLAELAELAELPAREALTRYPAIALFVQCARTVTPTFALTPTLAPIIAAICTRLDGIPLALELAAARLKVLSPHALLARLEGRLEGRLRLLTQGATDLPERQQTMRRAIAWSYDLLSGAEQRLFRRLAVFVDGWTLEAAEAICGAISGASGGVSDAEATGGPGRLERLGVLDGLTILVNSSLVVQEAGAAGEPRFRLLELMREYGWEQAFAHDDVSALRSRHADYYCSLAERAEPGLKGIEQTAWIKRLEREHNNLRAALGWAQAHEQVETGLRLAAALERFWELHGHLREGRGWLERLLATAEWSAVAISLRAKALGAAGRLAYRQSAYDLATPLLRQSLSLARDAGDTKATAGALSNLGILAMAQGDYGRAQALLEESLALWRILGDTWGFGSTLDDLGTVAHLLGDNERAAVLKKESLDHARAAGDKSQLAIALHNLGWVVHAQGDGGQAVALFEESLSIRREVGDTRGVATMLCSLGHLAHIEGDESRAAPLLSESLTVAQVVGDNGIVIHCLEDMARIGCAHGLAERAAWLFGAAAAVREAIGAPPHPDERADYDRNLADVRAALGDEAFLTAWAHGQALSLEEVIAMVSAQGTPEETVLHRSLEEAAARLG